jgi:pimeloyl-ACP methyl ester carboxylesterase
VITGEQDTTVPTGTQIILAKNIKGARHILVPGAGHAAIADHPGEVNSLLIEFLAPELQTIL